MQGMERAVVVGIAILVVLGLLFFLLGATQQSPTFVSFMGQQIPLVGVKGEDIGCIGSPAGFTMGYYSKEEGYHSVGYFREGNHLDEVIQWIKNKAANCGYSEGDTTQVALPGAQVIAIEFTADNKELTANVGITTATDGKQYTLVLLEESSFQEEEMEMGTGEEEEGQGGGTYDVGQGVTPVGISAQLNDQVLPVLKEVFGDAALKSWNEYNMEGITTVSLLYMVGRDIRSDDYEPIKNKLVALGWTLQGIANEDGTSLQFMYNNMQIIVHYPWGGNGVYVDATVLPSQ